MTDPVSLPFVMNQTQIDAAIQAELPRLFKNLKTDYTSGRAPRGLSATVTINEESIRAAVIAHARKLVNPTFAHFSVEFQATRGEDGITANIIASTAPIAPDADEASTPAAAPVATAPVEAPATEPTSSTEVESEAGGEAQTEVETPAETVDEDASTPPAPAAGRSKLFADLKRPSNETPAE